MLTFLTIAAVEKCCFSALGKIIRHFIVVKKNGTINIQIELWNCRKLSLYG